MIDRVIDRELFHRARLARRLSQTQLAEAAGISQGAISDIERGRNQTVRIDTLEALARALEVEPDTLLVRPSVRGQATLPGAEPVGEWFWAPVVSQHARASVGGVAPGEIESYQRTDGKWQGRNVVWVRINGNCLHPDVQTGDRVLVELGVAPQSGEIAVLRREGELMLKYWFSRGGAVWLETADSRVPVDAADEVIGTVQEVSRGKPRRRQPLFPDSEEGEDG